MKKSLVFILLAVISIACLAVLVAARPSTDVFESDINALASCEIKNKKGEVIYKCEGDEGECKASYLGNTLICSGKKKTL